MRILAIILAIFHGANGLVMLFAPDFWYASVPDVTETGPLNVHFVRDIGLAFLAAAAALGLFARDTTTRVLILPVVVFLGGHAGLHLVEMAAHGTNAADAARDLALIVLPGLLPFIFLRTVRP